MTSSTTITVPAPTRAWYMFRDAPVDAAARKNPLRWGRGQHVVKLAQELYRQSSLRPVRLHLETTDGELEREFDGTQPAALWLSSKYGIDLPDVTVRKPSTRASCNFLGCKVRPDITEDEIVVDPSDNSNLSRDSNDAATDGFAEGNSADATSNESSPDHAHDEDQVRLQFMWADAGLVTKLAEANPMRWTSLQSPKDVVTQLQGAPRRSVKLRVKFPGHYEIKTFKTPDEAVNWVREEFKVPEEECPERKCIICLEADVTVMLMPCRHAVLCEECAGTVLGMRNSRCPVCRTEVGNYARGHFADEYVDLVQAMEARMGRTQAALHEGMYNHLRPLMVTGALLGTGAVACFVVAPPVAIPLAGAALAVGYVPWFATTASYLESEDLSNRQLAPTSFFSRDDLARPLTLIAKTLTMAVVAPVAALVFYIPYGLFVIARPLAKALVHGLVRVSAFLHVYVNRPSGRGLARLSESLLNLLRDIGYGAYEHAMVLGNLLETGARSAGNALLTIAQHLRAAASTAARLTYDHVLCPVGRGIQYAAETTHRNVLQPIGSACHSAGTSVAHGLGVAARATSEAAQKVAELVGQGCVNIYSYVILPGGRGVVWVFQRTGDGLAAGAEAIYSYVLVPLGNGFDAGMDMLHSNVLVPCGNRLAAGASLLYSEVLVPLGQGSLRALGMMADGLWISGGFLYRNALAPMGQAAWFLVKALVHGTWVTLKALGNGLAKGAELVYSYALLPLGYGAAAVAYGAWRGGALTYQHLLVPIGQAIASGARTVHVYFLQPCGEAIQSLVRALANGAAAGAQAVYVYVLLPSGQAIRVAAVTSQAAISACAQTARDAAVSARDSGRQAVRATVDAFRFRA